MSGVLYVSYDGLLEPMGWAQVVPYLIRFAGKGVPIEVLSFEKPRDLRNVDQLEAMAAQLEEAGIVWHHRRYHRTPSVPATALDVWTGHRFVTRRAREAPGLVIHARSYVPGLMGLRAKRRHGARMILDTRGLWVDERVEAGRWKDGSPVVRGARKLESVLYRESDVIMHQTQHALRSLPRLFPAMDVAPIRVISTSADLSRFHAPDDAVALRRELGLGAGPILIHSGTLTGWYLGDLTFRIARAFVEQTGGQFVALTRDRELARRLAAAHGVQTTIQSVQPSEVPRWLMAADAGLALVRPTFSKTTACPVKVGEYLGTGLAVVGTRGVGDLAEHFEGSSVAFVIDPSDAPEEVARTLAAAVAVSGRRRLARAIALAHYDIETAVEGYIAIYRELGVTLSVESG